MAKKTTVNNVIDNVLDGLNVFKNIGVFDIFNSILETINNNISIMEKNNEKIKKNNEEIQQTNQSLIGMLFSLFEFNQNKSNKKENELQDFLASIKIPKFTKIPMVDKKPTKKNKKVETKSTSKNNKNKTKDKNIETKTSVKKQKPETKKVDKKPENKKVIKPENKNVINDLQKDANQQTNNQTTDNTNFFDSVKQQVDKKPNSKNKNLSKNNSQPTIKNNDDEKVIVLDDILDEVKGINTKKELETENDFVNENNNLKKEIKNADNLEKTNDNQNNIKTNSNNVNKDSETKIKTQPIENQNVSENNIKENIEQKNQTPQENKKADLQNNNDVSTNQNVDEIQNQEIPQEYDIPYGDDGLEQEENNNPDVFNFDAINNEEIQNNIFNNEEAINKDSNPDDDSNPSQKVSATKNVNNNQNSNSNNDSNNNSNENNPKTQPNYTDFNPYIDNKDSIYSYSDYDVRVAKQTPDRKIEVDVAKLEDDKLKGVEKLAQQQSTTVPKTSKQIEEDKLHQHKETENKIETFFNNITNAINKNRQKNRNQTLKATIPETETKELNHDELMAQYWNNLKQKGFDEQVIKQIMTDFDKNNRIPENFYDKQNLKKQNENKQKSQSLKEKNDCNEYVVDSSKKHSYTNNFNEDVIKKLPKKSKPKPVYLIMDSLSEPKEFLQYQLEAKQIEEYNKQNPDKQIPPLKVLELADVISSDKKFDKNDNVLAHINGYAYGDTFDNTMWENWTKEAGLNQNNFSIVTSKENIITKPENFYKRLKTEDFFEHNNNHQEFEKELEIKKIEAIKQEKKLKQEIKEKQEKGESVDTKKIVWPTDKIKQAEKEKQQYKNYLNIQSSKMEKVKHLETNSVENIQEQIEFVSKNNQDTILRNVSIESNNNIRKVLEEVKLIDQKINVFETDMLRQNENIDYEYKLDKNGNGDLVLKNKQLQYQKTEPKTITDKIALYSQALFDTKVIEHTKDGFDLTKEVGWKVNTDYKKDLIGQLDKTSMLKVLHELKNNNTFTKEEIKYIDFEKGFLSSTVNYELKQKIVNKLQKHIDSLITKHKNKNKIIKPNLKTTNVDFEESAKILTKDRVGELTAHLKIIQGMTQNKKFDLKNNKDRKILKELQEKHNVPYWLCINTDKDILKEFEKCFTDQVSDDNKLFSIKKETDTRTLVNNVDDWINTNKEAILNRVGQLGYSYASTVFSQQDVDNKNFKNGAITTVTIPKDKEVEVLQTIRNNLLKTVTDNGEVILPKFLPAVEEKHQENNPRDFLIKGISNDLIRGLVGKRMVSQSVIELEIEGLNFVSEPIINEINKKTFEDFEKLNWHHLEAHHLDNSIDYPAIVKDFVKGAMDMIAECKSKGIDFSKQEIANILSGIPISINANKIPYSNPTIGYLCQYKPIKDYFEKTLDGTVTQFDKNRLNQQLQEIENQNQEIKNQVKQNKQLKIQQEKERQKKLQEIKAQQEQQQKQEQMIKEAKARMLITR